MENVLNSIYSNSIMVQDQSNDTAKEAAVEAVHARVVAKPNFIRGSVELLVLYLLSQKDYYGYELSQLMDSLSDGVIKIPIGSLYPALYKLIEYGFISDHKEQVGKRMTRVYYHLEQPGFQRMHILITEFHPYLTILQSLRRNNFFQIKNTVVHIFYEQRYFFILLFCTSLKLYPYTFRKTLSSPYMFQLSFSP